MNPPTSIPFTDLCTLRNGLNFSGDQRGTEGVRVIDINAIPTTGIFPDQSDLYSVNVEASDKDLLQDGDLLIIRSHANKQRVGTTVLVEEAPANTSFSGFLIRSRPDSSRINSKYLTYFMRSRTARQQIVKGSGGTNINNINRTTLSQVEVPFFPLERQVEIVSLVDVAANQIDTATTHISELRALRSSILNTALTPSPVAEEAVGVMA